MQREFSRPILVVVLLLSGCLGGDEATETQDEYEPIVWEFTATEPLYAFSEDPDEQNPYDGHINLEMTQGVDLDYTRVDISVQKWGGGSVVWFPECSEPGETNCWDREDYYDNETWDVGSEINLISEHEGNYSVTITIKDCYGGCVKLGETNYTHEKEE